MRILVILVSVATGGLNLKNLFNKIVTKKKKLKIVFLDKTINDIHFMESSDIFDFFNYLYENNLQKKKFKTYCYDPKKEQILISIED